MTDPYLVAVAELYDQKMRYGLNRKLADIDQLCCNHNGILLPGENLDSYRAQMSTETGGMQQLHKMELNTIRLGRLYLGTPDASSQGLDAGCGGGGSALLIHKEYRSTVRGCTLSPLQCMYASDAARAHGYSSAVDFQVGNYLDLSDEPDSYDFIWACESTEHARDLDVMFREFRRVAKRGSRLVIIAWTVRSRSSPSALAVKDQVDSLYHCDCKTKGEYIAAANKHGWDLALLRDLTSLTIPYWALRSEVASHTNSDEAMLSAFSSRLLGYFLYVFDAAASPLSTY